MLCIHQKVIMLINFVMLETCDIIIIAIPDLYHNYQYMLLGNVMP